jgi:predicted peptidase
MLACVIRIPIGYQPESQVPLVLVLHDDWDRGAPLPPFCGKMLLIHLVDPGLRELEAILVAPDCQGRDWLDPSAEAAVLSLLAYLRYVYQIQERGIVVVGFGLGGAGAWHLAARHPDLFSAAIPIAGWPPEGAVETLDIPLYAINSRDDEQVPLYPTEEAVQRLRARGATVEFAVVEGTSHVDFRFVKHLNQANAWIQSLWAEQAESG